MSTAGLFAKGGSIKHLGPTVRDGESWHVFRLIKGETGGVDWIALLPQTTPKGITTIVDYEYLSSGQSASSGLGLFLLQYMDSKGIRFHGKQNSAFDKLYENREEIMAAAIATRSGDYEKAFKLSQSIPPEALPRKVWLLGQIRLAKLAKRPKEQNKATEMLLAEFPTDHATALVAIDFHITQGEHQKALEAVLAVEEASQPPDPYLKVVRSDVLRIMERYDAAREAANEALHDEPDLEGAVWSLITTSTLQKRYDLLADDLTLMAQRFDYVVPVEDDPDLAEFLTTPHYERYRNALPHNEQTPN